MAHTATATAPGFKVVETELDRVLLRRTQPECADEILLPPKVVPLRRTRLAVRQAALYAATYTTPRAQFHPCAAVLQHGRRRRPVRP